NRAAVGRDEKVEGLEQYLQSWGLLMRDSELRPGWAFKCPDIAIHHHGSLAAPGPYTEDERRAVLEALGALREPPEIKMCFRNATMLVHAATLAGVDLRYAEGKAAVMIPIDHAWCALPSGKPVDVTLRTNAEYDAGDDEEVDPGRLLARAEHNLAENAYWGYTVPSSARWKHLERVGRWCPVIDDPEGGYPLMRSRELPWTG
ncbi:MAG TPA: hypothetical protein VLL48_10740, partial [Longimicrobiales bacterium]|nr:hypothetical protein [Longimicrobiales bacterium]